MGKAIGIDLGTTNSCCAYVANGKPQVITYRDGSRTIPSVFAIDKSGNRLVGNEAKDQAEYNPNNTIAASKRLIGRSFGSNAMEKMQQVFTYELVEGESSEVLIKVADQVFTLEQISAAILRRIKESAEDALDAEVDQAVITVPAYFNDRQRQAVRSAGKLAGLKVLRVLNEPTAAALAYGLGRTLNQRVAIYDLGGGTFDISIIDIQGRVYEVIATGGDTFLGGVDFDDRLMKHVLEDFHAKHGVDLSFDRSAIHRIRDAAEATKIALSTHDQAHIQLDGICTANGRRLNVDTLISREKLEELTRDLVQRTIDTCRKIFDEANCLPTEIDEFLMVGGQSRMPLVHRAVYELTGRHPNRLLDPEHAVGLGAAIMAQAVRKPSSTAVTLRDVLPIPIGIRGAGNAMHVLFGKQSRLPAQQTRSLTTHEDNQRSIMLRIYQGEHQEVDDNELIGTFVFSGLRPGRAGTVGLRVTFDLNAEGELEISAHDPETEDHVQARIKFDPMGSQAKTKPRARRPMQPNTPAADAPIDDELMPPSPFAGSLKLPQPTLAESIEGTSAADALSDLFDDIDLELEESTSPGPVEYAAKASWLSRLGQTLFGR